MARTARAVVPITSAGVAPTLTAVDSAAGETMPWNGKRMLHVKNASGGSVNVTVRSSVSVDGQATTLNDRVVAVPAAGEKFISLVSGSYYQADGNTYVDYSASASVTAELIEAT